jgi:hypothetical protein
MAPRHADRHIPHSFYGLRLCCKRANSANTSLRIVPVFHSHRLGGYDRRDLVTRGNGFWVVYKNVVLQFGFDTDGNLILLPGYPQVTKAPAMIVSDFKAGTYVGPSTVLDGMALVNLSGPGVTTGGATEWSLSAASGANGCTYPSTATFYVGALTSSPYAARLKSAGITSTAWSYGVGSSSSCGGSNWYSNALIGASQIGNTLTIVSFSYAGTDYGIPQATIVYTLKQ